MDFPTFFIQNRCDGKLAMMKIQLGKWFEYKKGWISIYKFMLN